MGSGLGQFGVSLGSVWVSVGDLGHLMVTLQSLWIHFGYMKVLFQKTFIFPTYFNDFIKLFGGLWVDLGLLWDRFRHMKVNLGPLWGHFGVTLGSLWAYRRRMACMMCIVAGLMVSFLVPNGSISKLYTFLRRILLVKGTAAKLEPAATERAGPSGRG